MALCNRYDDPACGVRLDQRANPDEGPALDLYTVVGSRPNNSHATLWIRNKDGDHVKIRLDVADIRALRDGCSHFLVETGVERRVEVAVPR